VCGQVWGFRVLVSPMQPQQLISAALGGWTGKSKPTATACYPAYFGLGLRPCLLVIGVGPAWFRVTALTPRGLACGVVSCSASGAALPHRQAAQDAAQKDGMTLNNTSTPRIYLCHIYLCYIYLCYVTRPATLLLSCHTLDAGVLCAVGSSESRRSAAPARYWQ
jgi:hypothetical protein